MKGRVLWFVLWFVLLVLMAALALTACQRSIPRSGEYPIEARITLAGEWESPLRLQMDVWGEGSPNPTFYTYAFFGEGVSPAGDWDLFRVVPAGKYRVQVWAAHSITPWLNKDTSQVLAESRFYDVWVPPAKSLEITLER